MRPWVFPWLRLSEGRITYQESLRRTREREPSTRFDRVGNTDSTLNTSQRAPTAATQGRDGGDRRARAQPKRGRPTALRMWHLVETAAGLRVGRKPAGKVRSRLRTPLCDRARKSCESHGRATLTHGKHEERKPASKASPAVRKVREIAALRCACCPRSKQGVP